MDRDFQRDWFDKKVAVVGLGISNRALIRFLKKAGAHISGRDLKTSSEMEALDIDLVLGSDYLRDLTLYDSVMVSPGIPKDLPELQEITDLGRLESEIGLVFRYSRGAIYAVTGSSGKTTTTSLVGEMLTTAGIPNYVGGNIGTPLIDRVEEIKPDDRVVLELSSFQLESIKQSPHGAVITNIAENHLDFHHTMPNYIKAKENIYRYQKPTDFIILNYDDPITRAMAAKVQSEVFFFSLRSEVPSGTYLDGNNLVYSDQDERVIFGQRSKLVLPGEHNVANYLAAALLSYKAGADWQAIRQVGESFSGVPHRLEFVAEVAGVRYYNDSIATTPDRSMAALRSFTEPIILIAGGSDKGLSYAEFGQAIKDKVKHLILLGNTAPKIRAAVLDAGGVSFDEVEDLPEAVALGAKMACPGDIVLLSPASASFDHYTNFMERGMHFSKLVSELKEDKK